MEMIRFDEFRKRFWGLKTEWERANAVGLLLRWMYVIDHKSPLPIRFEDLGVEIDLNTWTGVNLLIRVYMDTGYICVAEGVSNLPLSFYSYEVGFHLDPYVNHHLLWQRVLNKLETLYNREEWRSRLGIG